MVSLRGVLTDRSIQWGAIWFVPIFALHRWVAVQISLFLPLFSPLGESLTGWGLIWQSPQPSNNSSDRGECASPHISIQGFGEKLSRRRLEVWGVGRLVTVVS